MVRVSVHAMLKLAGKLVLLVNVIIFVVNYRWTVSNTSHGKKVEITKLSTHYYIPQCFGSIDDLAKSTRNKTVFLDIRCNKTEAKLIYHIVNLHNGPHRLNWTIDVNCLKTFVQDNCYTRKGHVIPNIIHYVWFGHVAFKAEHLVSVLSADRFQQPCAILFHAQEPPFGPYWTVLLSIVSKIILVQRDEPSTIFGKKFGFIQHKSDIARLEILNELGGIYMDNDQILVRDVHELLNESFVMSHENKNNLANSMILAQPGAAFIDLWYAQYQWYSPKKWGYHSTYVPWILARQHSGLIKVVENRFVKPDLTDILQVYYSHYDLRSNYALHLYTRFHPKIELTLPDVTATWNSSLGELWRTIIYNSPDMFVCSQRNNRSFLLDTIITDEQ